MGRALDQHAPAFSRRMVEVVDLEGDPVLGMRDAGPQVLIRGAVLGGPEQDRAVIQLVVDREARSGRTGRRTPAADTARGDEPQALGLIQFLEHGLDMT